MREARVRVQRAYTIATALTGRAVKCTAIYSYSWLGGQVDFHLAGQR